MTCPSPLACSMYADCALPAPEAAEIGRHLSACPACRSRVAALSAESRVLSAVLGHEGAAVRVPELRRPISLRHVLASAAALAALALGPLAVWAALASLRLPPALEWLNPFNAARLADLAFSFLVYLVSEGSPMMTSAVQVAGGTVLAAMLVFGALAVLRARIGKAALLAALAAVVLPSLGQALEIRHSEQVLTVPAAETIDDTLIAFGDSIEIDGTVTGDLIAMGRRVNVRGTVQGQLFTAARSVTIDGDVGGSVLGFAETLAVTQSEIGRNLIGFARDVSTASDASVDGNAIVFAADADIRGPVGIDVVGFANEIAIGGAVNGDVTAHAGRVTLLAPAVVGGDVVAHVGSEDALQVSPSATVGGTVQTEVEERHRPESEYASGSFYAWQAVRLGAAFLTGLLVLGVAASLRRATPGDTGTEVLTTAFVGLVTAVATPIVAVIVAITLIGLPIALLMFLLWMAALYFAKILLSYFVGRKLFERAGRRPHFALSLIVGLVIVLILINIPFIGALLNFLFTITGLGMLVIFVWGRMQGRSFSGGGPDGADA